MLPTHGCLQWCLSLRLCRPPGLACMASAAPTMSKSSFHTGRVRGKLAAQMANRQAARRVQAGRQRGAGRQAARQVGWLKTRRCSGLIIAHVYHDTAAYASLLCKYLPHSGYRYLLLCITPPTSVPTHPHMWTAPTHNTQTMSCRYQGQGGQHARAGAAGRGP